MANPDPYYASPSALVRSFSSPVAHNAASSSAAAELDNFALALRGKLVSTVSAPAAFAARRSGATLSPLQSHAFPPSSAQISVRRPLFPAASPPRPFSGGAGSGRTRPATAEEVEKLKQEVVELTMKLRQLSLANEDSRHKKVISICKRVEVNWLKRDGNLVEISFQCSCGRNQKVVAKIE